MVMFKRVPAIPNVYIKLPHHFMSKGKTFVSLGKLIDKYVLLVVIICIPYEDNSVCL